MQKGPQNISFAGHFNREEVKPHKFKQHSGWSFQMRNKAGWWHGKEGWYQKLKEEKTEKAFH